MICFVAQPLLMHKDMNLELKRTLEPRVMSREELAKTGTVPRQEIIGGDCHKFCVHGIIGARHTGTPHEHDYQETNLS